ncbi:MAG: hypothetical protein I8H95_06310 [Rhodocyclales bacterium]|nr:hypothetical protein [Rhodocyclales bacterium]
MDRSRLREIQNLEFRDPKDFLIELKKLEGQLVASVLDPKVRRLRTNNLKEWRETRDAALFCYGMGQRIGQTVFLARGESQDYDFVASCMVGDVQHFAPVQLKEFVPSELNSTTSLKKIIDSLNKYGDSKELTVAIRLNRQVHFDPQTVVVPQLRIAALWVFGSISEDQTEWGLWGDFLEKPEGSRFLYPD